jgi:hypothetical protein
VPQDIPASKPCSKCGEDKPLNEYHPQRDGKDGVRGDCRVCVNAARRAKNANGPRARARAAERPGFKCCNRCWQVKPVEEFSPAKRGRYGVRGECKACASLKQSERNRRRWANDPEYRAKYLAENAKWREQNRDRHRELSKRHYRENRELKLEQGKQWRRDHRLKMIEYGHRQIALKWGVEVEPVDLAAVLARHPGCYLCGRPLETPLDFDHVIPFSQGGPHIESNIRPTHRTCNRQKHARTPDQLPEGWLKL